MKRKISLIAFLCIVLLTTSSEISIKAQAFSLGDIVNNIKDVFSPSQAPATSLTITPKISLAPGEDINNNGKIDAGDTVRFSYTILNTTKNSYKFATLKTSLDTKILNGIGNVQGATSLHETNNTVTIPNLIIEPSQVRTISFDAHINFYSDQDRTITGQPTLLDQNGNTIVSGSSQTVTATKMDTATFNKFVHINQ